jgi:hypothetical protein
LETGHFDTLRLFRRATAGFLLTHRRLHGKRNLEASSPLCRGSSICDVRNRLVSGDRSGIERTETTHPSSKKVLNRAGRTDGHHSEKSRAEKWGCAGTASTPGRRCAQSRFARLSLSIINPTSALTKRACHCLGGTTVRCVKTAILPRAISKLA